MMILGQCAHMKCANLANRKVVQMTTICIPNQREKNINPLRWFQGKKHGKK